MIRREFIQGGVLGGLALRSGLRAQPAQPAPQKPNVLLIVAGVWRAQAVPWAGDKAMYAPSLTKLARQSLAFSRAYACYSRRDHSLPCLLTSVFPHVLSGADGASDEAAQPPSLRTLLAAAGYRAARFTSRQADDIVTFVHAPAAQPFFAEWIFDNIAPGLMERPDLSSLRIRDNVPGPAQTAAHADVSAFYARAKIQDIEIGTVLEALDRAPATGAPASENTIVVFTSLHGEQLGSHNLFSDDVFYEESMRVPLLIRYPKAISQPGANDLLVSQVDLAPTLLQWCGVPAPPSMQGRDLSALLSGAPQAGPRPEAIYGEGQLGQKDEWRMLVAGYDKLVSDLAGNVTHLYNLADDPYELTNLATASAQQLKRDELLAEQRIWMKKLADGVDASGLKKR